MSSPLYNEMEAALQDLRAQQANIRQAQQRLEAETTTVTTKDRMLTATVDHRQRLTGLKFSADRYRNLAPAELANRIVEVVQQAQQEAGDKSVSIFADLAPTGFGPGIPDMINGVFDLDRMFDDAVQEAGGPLFGEPGESTAATEQGRDRG